MKLQFVSVIFPAGEEGQVQKEKEKKWKCKIRSFLSIAGNFMRSKKAAQGLSEEKAFVCLALAVHKASERILFRDHQLLFFCLFFLLWNASPRKVVRKWNYEWLHPNGVKTSCYYVVKKEKKHESLVEHGLRHVYVSLGKCGRQGRPLHDALYFDFAYFRLCFLNHQCSVWD